MNERDKKGIKNIIKHIIQTSDYTSHIQTLEEFSNNSLVVDEFSVFIWRTVLKFCESSLYFKIAFPVSIGLKV